MDGCIFLMCNERPDLDLQILPQWEQEMPTPAEAGKELGAPKSSSPPPVAAVVAVALFLVIFSAIR